MVLNVLIPGYGVVFAQEPTNVVEVSVTGNQVINTETILNVITLKPGDEYTEQVVERDRAAIMSLGFFSAVTVRKEEVSGGVKISYEVTENPKVTDIKIVGSEPWTPEKVLGLMRTKPGQVLNTTTLNNDIEAIQEAYREAGFFAYVTEDIGVDPKTGVLTVPILVHIVESVEITGNKKTRSYVFLREMKTKPGQIFNNAVLKEDLIRIYNLDILEDIKTPDIREGSEPGLVKITIPVVEKKTGQISLGFGYSSRQRLVGQARLTESNFRGRGQGVNLLWEQGTSDAVGGSSSYEVGFYEPWIDKRHTSLSVSAFNKVIYRFSSGIFNTGETIGDKIYNERRKGADLTLSRPLTEKLRGYIGLRGENVDTDPALINTISGNVQQLAQITQTGDVYSGSFRLVHNTRDIDIDPAAGGYEAISLELGRVDAERFNAIPSGSSYIFDKLPFEGTFRKTSLDFRRYFSRGGRKNFSSGQANYHSIPL